MRPAVWIGFGLWCLLSSVTWLLPDVPDGMPALERKALVYAIAALAALLVRGKGLASRITGSQPRSLAAAGILFFAVPAGLMEWAHDGISAVNASAVFAFLPVVVVLAVANGSGASNSDGARRLLASALVAFGGVLLLLPVELPASPRGRVMLAAVCAAVVLVAVSGVWLYGLLQQFNVTDAIMLVGGANAVFLLLWCVLARRFSLSGAASLISLSSLQGVAEFMVMSWLLREMPPVRLAARYLLIPLLTVVEGFVVMRPEFTVRMASGVALLAAGTGWILFSRDPKENELSLSLR